MTRKLAEYLVRFHDENPGFNRYFRTMYAPDEAYFHTIVYNSPFAAHTPKGKAAASPHLTDFENLTYFEYPADVTLFTEKKDWPKLRDSGFLFFRKASSQSKVLNRLYCSSIRRGNRSKHQMKKRRGGRERTRTKLADGSKADTARFFGYAQKQE